MTQKGLAEAYRDKIVWNQNSNPSVLTLNPIM